MDNFGKSKEILTDIILAATSSLAAWKAYKKGILPIFIWVRSSLFLGSKIGKVEESNYVIKSRIQAYLSLTPIALYEADPITGYYTNVNRAWLEIYGLEHENAMGSNWLNPIKEQEKIEKIWYKTIRSNSLFDEKYTIINQETTEEIKVRDRTVFQRNRSGAIVAIIGTVTKIENEN